MEDNHFFVYIVSDEQVSPLQIGVTKDLYGFIESQNPAKSNPDSKSHKLVYYEHYDQENIALDREKEIKRKSVEDTANLVDSMNPNWLDLSDTLID
jgi:putative endonuclease